MKSNKETSINLSIFAVFFIALNLSGCLSHWQGGMAEVVISFGGADRAVYDPDDTATHKRFERKIVLTGGLCAIKSEIYWNGIKHIILNKYQYFMNLYT